MPSSSANRSFHSDQIKELVLECYENKTNYDILSDNEHLKPLLKHLYIKHGVNVQALVTVLLPLVAVVCGPKTKMRVLKKSMEIKLNHFSLICGEPSSGKSRAYEAVGIPIMQEILEKHGIEIEVQDYTKEGLEQHLIDNKGYGMVTTDEGATVLTAINSKTQEGKGEQSYVCMWWGGRASKKRLVSQSRTPPPTSLGILLLIQPEAYLAEVEKMSKGPFRNINVALICVVLRGSNLQVLLAVLCKRSFKLPF